MKIYKVIGLMSGTSLDGLDMVYTHIWKENDSWKYNIKRCKTITYSKDMQTQLAQSITLEARDLLALDISYGKWLGQQARTFIEQNNIPIDFIASHGHTTHHCPKQGFTFQIGAGEVLAHESNCLVISDFRNNDIALGGQGAPLVPIGDRHLFGAYDFCLNMGGICNISFESNGCRVAYDIGICNMLLNYLASKKKMNYDKGGILASKGNIIGSLYDSLNNIAYYREPYPKSTGYEWFTDKILPLVSKYNEKIENILCTSVHHICEQIALSLNTNAKNNKQKILITGGGAYNDFLISTLKSKLNNNFEYVFPSKQIIDYKEALIFAFMGVLKAEGEINVLASVTGAKKDSVSGISYSPN